MLGKKHVVCEKNKYTLFGKKIDTNFFLKKLSRFSWK